MGSLYVGTDVISLRDVIFQVNRNIEEIQEKLRNANRKNCRSKQIQKFYQEKIDANRITLEWLRRHYQPDFRG